ncbi:MAG TPA: ferrous iron transport protein A [Clostridia bacterium]|jgi:ferrous iron transport protein A|nr:ferrous iron transport protein A [Clostridia bacterium]
MKNYIPLHQLSLGSRARIKNLALSGQLRSRMLDLGFINDTVVEALYCSPWGDPCAYQARGTIIALRHEVAGQIWVEQFS